MKIGVFADVHGNIYAFDKIVSALKKEKCDLYCFAGDICGYYYHQADVIDIFRGMKDLLCVMGNHDAIFLKMLKDSKYEKSYSEKYGKSSTFLKNTISKSDVAYLKELPRKLVIKEAKICMVHGSPWDNLEEYVYPTDKINKFGDLPYRFVILGHTHYPMVRKAKGVLVVNPGSCGQPRDYNMPSYAVIDTDSGKADIKRVKYDHRKMVKDVKDRKETLKYLVDVLKRSKDGKSS